MPNYTIYGRYGGELIPAHCQCTGKEHPEITISGPNLFGIKIECPRCGTKIIGMDAEDAIDKWNENARIIHYGFTEMATTQSTNIPMEKAALKLYFDLKRMKGLV